MNSLIKGQAAPRGAFNSEQALPRTKEEITTQWLSNVLGVEVKDFQIDSVKWGVSSKFFVNLTFAHGVQTEIPRRVCIKGGFNTKVLEIAPDLADTYRREAEFYYYVAPLANMLLPKTYFCGTDAVNGQGIVIMSDIAGDCTFGSPAQTWELRRVEQLLDQMAGLHAQTWNTGEKAYPWLFGKDGTKLNKAIRGAFRSFLNVKPEDWKAMFDRECCSPVAEPLRDQQRMKDAFEAFWKHHDSDFKYQCIIHGDTHTGNTFIQKDGTPGLLDWQTLEYGSAFNDVAHFLVGALSVEDRRKHEVSLVESYLNSLHARGGPKLTKDEIWDEYRRCQMNGYGWSVVPTTWQPAEFIYAMSERHSASLMDHKTLELLGV